MKCIIIDDDAVARSIIRKFCSKIDNLVIKQEFSTALEAIPYVNEQAVDLVFLDIHMPELNGFEFIESVDNPPKIILTTSDKDFALNAFEYPCIIDYMVKPIRLSRFLKSMQKLEGTPTDNNNNNNNHSDNHFKTSELYVNIDRRFIKIKISDIYLIQAKGDYIDIKTESKDYTVHTTLKNIANKLPETYFLKVHRSYIINTKKIIDIEDNSVLIKKEVIPISRSKRAVLFQRLNLLN
ncbi:MAG: DNA-binding response regulator [Flavobacteriaceae bacterium]|nr:MAG: DNA-binding response regulator [Flavobacteriaceae bacterium]